MTEISDETSKRMCMHMNDDHGLSVYAMVISTADSGKMKISNCKLEKITLTHMNFSFVACDTSKGICVPNTAEIKFLPPLQSSSEVRPRLVDIHHQVLAPKFSWFITDSTARTVVLALGPIVAIYLLGMGVFLQLIDKIENTVSIRVADFLPTETAFSMIEITAKLTIFIHLLEGLYVVSLCSKLKLKLRNTFSWFLAVFIGGLPMTQRVMDFVRVQNETKKEDKHK